jgi:hypothetical protein
MQSLTKLMAMAATVGFMAYSTQAALVTVDGVKVFEDTFEAGTVGSAPGVNDPQVGTWGSSGTGTTIMDAGLAGFAAFEGDQFLRFAGTSTGITSTTVNVGSTGDVQVISFAFRIDVDGGTDASLMIRVTQDDGLQPVRPMIYADGTIRARPFGGGSDSQIVVPGLSHNIGEWNTMTLTWVIGASQYEIDVNGTAVMWDSLNASSSGFRSLNFRQDNNKLINPLAPGYDPTLTESAGLLAYVDAIPEPASLALIGLGGLLMLRRQRA